MASQETFYHVYELPDRGDLAKGFAFNGGNPISFLNVDWFNGIPAFIGGPETEEMLRENLRTKKYIKPGKRYLVLGSPGFTFVMEPTP